MEELPRFKIERPDGITASERHLKHLCDRTFLSLWSYSGVFRNQGKTVSGHGKEVCDLLVVFDNHVIIFSDKDCKFPNTNNLERDWCRWFRRAVLESANQVYGAERWLKTQSDRLFLDRECTQPFPLDLPSPRTATFHRVVVAHGASRRCQEILGGSGSLMLIPRITGPMHYDPKAGPIRPFAIGQVDSEKGYLHVLDDTTLNILLHKLDTISDFVNYLTRKEKFVTSGKLEVAAGEEELLGYYLGKLNKEGDHDFIIASNINKISFDVGIWEDFENSPERKSQVKADDISYMWDRLIEKFARHILQGTSLYNSHPRISDQVIPIRFMAAENRVRRRLLAHSLYDFIKKTPPRAQPGFFLRANRVLKPTKPGEPYYVFLLLSVPTKRPLEEYREARRLFLEHLCLATKDEFPDALDIIGIAMEPGLDGPKTEDALYFDARAWNPELQAEAQDFRKEFNLLSQLKQHRIQTQEYPISSKQTVRNKPQSVRNSLCPCRSGKKFKKCCGRSNRRTI